MPMQRLIRSVTATAAHCAVLGWLLAASILAAPAAGAGFVQDSEQVAPGNPVVSSELPGDGNGDADRADYALLALLATCLIGAGVLLVSVERWERRRSGAAFADSRH